MFLLWPVFSCSIQRLQRSEFYQAPVTFVLIKSVALIGGTVKLKEDRTFSENVEGVYSSVNNGKHSPYF